MSRTRSEVVTGEIPVGIIPYPKPSSVVRELQKLIGRLVISPLCLIVSLLVLYFVPESLLRSTGRSRSLRAVWDVLDRGMDFTISLSALALLSPLFFLVWILIKLDSNGPVFYCQERVGKNYRNNHKKIWLSLNNPVNLSGYPVKDRRKRDLYGRPFKLYKFRTMRVDAELHTGPIWATEEDPRVTRIGKLLRATYIDEIPQLINVLKGDMSLVGPRPERPYFTSQLAEKIPGYSVRFCVKPGITGLAQTRRYADSSIEDVKKKLKYDIFYCQKRCLSLKIKVMASTAGWALRRAVASRRIFRGRRNEKQS